MLKRLTAAVIGIVGLVVIGLGIASATVWRADDVLVATTSGGANTLVTDPGVLELGGDPVTVTATVPDDGTVVLAIGRDTDVAGWVGTDAHGQVTGLSSWHTLAVDEVEAPAPTPVPTDAAAAPADPAQPDAAAPSPTEGTADAPVPVADPSESDLWVAQDTGTGSAELVWPATEGRWSLLAVSTGDSPPTLELAWPRVVTTPWLWPCVAVGTLLVLLAAWLLLRGARRRRAGLDAPQWHPVTTGATPTVVVSDDIDAIPVLTRRQMREAAQAHMARPRTGPVPQVPAPQSAPSASPAPAEPSRAPVPTGASAGAAGTAGAATSRRALRPPTGAIPVTPSSPAPDQRTPAPGWAPAADRTPGAPPPPPGRQTPAPALPTSAPGRPSTTPAGPAGPGGTPGRPAGAPAVPGRPGDEVPAAPHGRPSWVRGSAGPATTSAPGAAPAPVAGPDRSGPAGWSAVPPPPGARVRPGSPAGPDSSAHAGRPTWVRPGTADAAPPDDPATAGSRADAWRRAWGLPPTEGAPDGTQDETSSRGEQR
ncbi:hypothetical protein [Cellulomonas xylanilytica]|uniref:Uncharacterized protein n=1 Tax=Cellulomonas xylanilytica TaxID=233583 RepID=A0A510V6X8_9CELL|nr:hypothetical protein [Cellulomonas xylanilytica]GEK22546.1 hypothetical protein CXY01_30660 [Cellulomonas xylanilytica]